MSKRKCYIAGPMRGYPEFNFPAFDAAAALGRSLGFEIISPAEMDREHGINEKGNNGADVFTEEQTREFIRRDVNILVNTLKAENADAIAVLPGWEKSTGAFGEWSIAKWAKLMFLDARTFERISIRVTGVEVIPFYVPAEFRTCGCSPIVASSTGCVIPLPGEGLSKRDQRVIEQADAYANRLEPIGVCGTSGCID